jgi:hypothetical protein
MQKTVFRQSTEYLLSILKLIKVSKQKLGSKITESTFLLENNQLEFILCLGRLLPVDKARWSCSHLL